MAFFQYTARDAAGAVHRGVVEVASRQEAVRRIKAGGLYPVVVKPVKSYRRRSVPAAELIGFFRDLSDLLSSGLPLDRALILINTNQRHKVFKKVTGEILDDVRGGGDLSEAISKHKDIFGELPAHMVRAGEASATLPAILMRLAEYLERRRAFRQTLVSALVYPSILMTISLLSMVILLVYVIPRFAQIFRDLNQEVPFITQVMVQAGVFLERYGWVIPIMLLAVFFLGRWLHRQPAVRMAVDRAVLAVPLVRSLVLYAELARFCRTLGTMIQSGVPLLRSIQLVEDLLFNSAVRRTLVPLKQEIKIGHSVSGYFRSNPLFPPRMGTMLRIAEERGGLGPGLIGLGEHYEAEMERILQRLLGLLEPMVILFTGAAIGAMVLSMFSAIFGITDIQL